MKRLLQVVLPVFIAVLVNLLTLGTHSSALSPGSGHGSASMSHKSTTSLTCFAICTASTPEKQRVITADDEKDEDEPTIPFYLAAQQSLAQAFEEKHSGEARLAAALQPPPGPPIYVLNSVLRF